MVQPANVFSVRDASGAVVYLSRRVWRDHILARHGRMHEYLDDIKATITNPQRIYDDTNYAEGLSYWRRGAGGVAERRRNLWLVVVVNYKRSLITRRQYGEVVTAYFTAPTPGEEYRVHDDE